MGIVDVGANTVRLLVASADQGCLVSIREDRAQLGLGEEIERTGRIGEKKLSEAAETAKAHVRRARKLGCTSIAVLVTSPGRQAANGQELVSHLAEATGVATHVLSAQEEGELAWRGAVTAAANLPATVAVCDIGGGSAQIAVGTGTRPSWVRSLDIGSLRLTRRAFRSDPPDAEDVARATSIVTAAFDELTPPLPLAAIAVLSKKSSGKIAKEYGLDETRARTMAAGALILLEIHRRLAVPLQVGRGGVREGAALALLESAEAAVRSA